MKLKELLIDWLTESRYIKALERFHVEQRQDFTQRLAEKDDQIHSLRIEIAALKMESDRMRLILMPLGSPAGAQYAATYSKPQYKPPADKPAFEPVDDWQTELNKAIQEDERAHSQGRKELHEQGADDVPQQVS